MAIDQNSFRFRNDDGSESGATWKAATNSDITIPASGNYDFRIRFLIQSDAADSLDFKLQYRVNGGTWTDVTISSSVILSITSSNFANGDSTTQQIGGGVFVEGTMDEDDTSDGGTWAAVDFDGSDETELEGIYRVIIADVSQGDDIELRLVEQVGTVLDSYTEIPLITIQGVPSLKPFKDFEGVRPTESLEQIVGILTYNSGTYDFYMVSYIRRPIGGVPIIESGSFYVESGNFSHTQSLGVGINTVDGSKTGYLHGVVNEFGFADKHMSTKEVTDFLGTHHMSMKGYSEDPNLPGRTIFGGSGESNYLQYKFPDITNPSGFRDYTVYRTNDIEKFIGTSTSGLLFDTWITHDTNHESGAYVTFTWQDTEAPSNTPYWSGTFLVPSGEVTNYRLDAPYIHIPRGEINYEDTTLGNGILDHLPFSSYLGIEIRYPSGMIDPFYGDLKIHSFSLGGSGLFEPDIITKTTNLYISGSFIPDSGNIPLYVEGAIEDSGSIPLYLLSFGTENSGIPLFLHSNVAAELPLFIKVKDAISGVATAPLFLWATEDSGVFDKTTLFVEGGNSPSGLMNLYIGGDPVLESYTTNMNLYLRTIGNDDGSLDLNGQIDLFLMNEISGDNSNIDLFMMGPEGNSGNVPVSGTMNLFIARSTESIDHNLSMYIPGPSGFNDEISLFIQGGNSGVNSNFTMFVSGIIVPDNNIELFVRGL